MEGKQEKTKSQLTTNTIHIFQNLRNKTITWCQDIGKQFQIIPSLYTLALSFNLATTKWLYEWKSTRDNLIEVHVWAPN